jgi:hypothetical protein
MVRQHVEILSSKTHGAKRWNGVTPLGGPSEGRAGRTSRTIGTMRFLRNTIWMPVLRRE